MEKKRNGNIIPIIICVFIVFVAILASVAFIYHENKISELQSKIDDLELQGEEEVSIEIEKEVEEWGGRKVLGDNNFVYFDPNGITYHSSPDCPFAKEENELTRMIYSEFSETKYKRWIYRSPDATSMAGTDIFFPCELCIY